MKLYLVENVPNIAFEGNIVALTPEACYWLDKRGLKYSIIEDYSDKPPTEEYFSLFD